jgi:hypothetical protein
MTVRFVGRGFWGEVTKRVRSTPGACAVAVAYFSKGASERLPLKKGSRLVVDASLQQVSSGQTCPHDLLKLVENGVDVFSMPQLHAKVFVIGNTAYVGSSNVSANSEHRLQEAAILTTNRKAVSDARKFVSDLCKYRQTPEQLRELSKAYRPPKDGGRKNGAGKESVSPFRLRMVKLRSVELSEEDELMDAKGAKAVERDHRLSDGYEVDSFRLTGKVSLRVGDVVVQVMDEGDGRIMVSPPGNVLRVYTRKRKQRTVSFVYIECPLRRWRRLASVAKALGCEQKRLGRNGLLADPLAGELLALWNR